jgi:carbon monoxide dehydrogenase subunit G
VGLRDLKPKVQRACRYPWLDRPEDNHYQCGSDRAESKEIAMKLEGTYEVPAPRKKVWDAFQDPKVLKKAIPGCEKLEAIGPDEYKATMKVGVGGVKGTFEGKVKLSDKQAPDSYKMNVEGAGGPGFIRGETIITLTDRTAAPACRTPPTAGRRAHRLGRPAHAGRRVEDDGGQVLQHDGRSARA